MEEAIDQLRETLTHPQTEPGLTELEFLIRQFEKSASSILKAEGFDPDPDELWWEEDSDLGVRLASAKDVMINAWYVRDSVESGNFREALVYMMLLTASAVRSELFESAMLGESTERAIAKGGKSSGQTRSQEAAARHEHIVDDARKLLNSGRASHEISSILAKRHEISARQIRSILIESGLRPKKRK